MNDEQECIHDRLLLQATPSGYLTGRYICEVCGEEFDSRQRQPKPEEADDSTDFS